VFALLAVWMRGAWPMLLPGGSVLVFVPTEHDGQVVPWIEGDPVDADAEAASLVRHGPRRRPIAAERSGRLPTWWQLGLSVPLVYAPRESRVEVAGSIGGVSDAPIDFDLDDG